MFSKTLFFVSVLAAACASAHAAKPVTGSIGDVQFPDRQRSYLPQGDFTNVGNLREMRAGLSKSQVRLLLGNPHFKEGLFGVDEWNYIFNFSTGAGDAFITCQYQVRYDKEDGDYRSRSLHWDKQDCLDLLNAAPAPAADPPAVVAAVAPERFTLSADALFRFGRADVQDIVPEGAKEIGLLAEKILKAGEASIRVIGHADRIGDASGNQALSQRRAETVRRLLIDHGVPAGNIVAEGRGKAEPVTTHCADNLSRQALVACLAPDRRVEVMVEGVGGG